MILFRIILVFSIIFSGCSKGITHDSINVGSSKKVTYRSLLDRVKDNDLSINFRTLRLLYTKEPDYNVYYYDVEDISSLNIAFRNNQYKKALKYANKILKKKFVDPETHFICSVIYKELGDNKKYDYHYNVSKGLLWSIKTSGDGESLETAFLVIDIDEQFLILSGFGLKPYDHELTKHNGRYYNKLVGIDGDGEKQDIYFDITILFSWLNKRLNKGEERTYSMLKHFLTSRDRS